MSPEKCKILAVDDNEAHNYALRKMLEHRGFQVMPAFTGTQTIELAQQQPDIVLLDVNLPDVNGFEVCRRLKKGEKTKDIPVVFISATHQTTTAVNEAKEAGADNFLFYPVEPDHLVMVVRGVVERRTVGTDE
jgi:PleD family two-component response regulator